VYVKETPFSYLGLTQVPAEPAGRLAPRSAAFPARRPSRVRRTLP
jgi:hypothetical protein